VIWSFTDKRTAAIWADRRPKGFPNDLAKVARRKLRALAAAIRLEDLRRPTGNHPEALAGGQVGQHSIRGNDQWKALSWRRSPTTLRTGRARRVGQISQVECEVPWWVRG
jgi:proteic killer suppression protein